MLTVRFIRHGESVANAGGVTEEPHSVPLTALGREQARALSRSFARPPDLIITSPYFRAHDTAKPTAARFADVPLGVWPVHEICCLAPGRCAGTTAMERRPWVEAYWDLCDPHRRDGEGAESYMEFTGRVRAALARLTQLPPQDVVIFSHGQFMKAIEWEIVQGSPPIDADAMRGFRASHITAPIANVEGFTLAWDGESWRIESHHPSPPPGNAELLTPRA